MVIVLVLVLVLVMVMVKMAVGREESKRWENKLGGMHKVLER